MIKDMVLTTLADKNYVTQAKQLFSSVYLNSGWRGDYLLLSHGICKDDLEWFRAREIEVFECEPIYDRYIGKWPPTILSKFYLFTDFFNRWDRVVYLDGDVMVEASLGELGTNGGFKAVMDVHNIPIRKQFIEGPMVSRKRYLRELVKELEDDHEMTGPSFNCGVLSFPTKLIKGDTFQVIVDLFFKYRRIVRFPEQAILNLYFSNKWSSLPIVYNNYYTRIRYPWRFGTVPFNGICNHFIDEKPWIVKDSYFYPQWKRYLELAGSMDIRRRKGPTRIWSNSEISTRSRAIETLMVNRSLMTRVGDGTMMGLERCMGVGGKALRKVSPSLYTRIKGTGYFGDRQ